MRVKQSYLQSVLSAIRKMPPLLPESEREKHSIDDSRAGGYLGIEHRVYRVDSRCRFVVDSTKDWHELNLYGLNDGRESNLRWRPGEKSAGIATQFVTLDQTGVSEDDLSRIYEEEKGSFVFNGVIYRYGDSGKASVYSQNGELSEDIFFWDFDGSDGTNILFRRWMAADYEVFRCRQIDTRKIEVLLPGRS